jgi:ketosteroid isomerase-like protein
MNDGANSLRTCGLPRKGQLTYDGGSLAKRRVRLVQVIRATGKTLDQSEVIHHFTFRNGKVVRCRVGEDTAQTKAAFAK